MTCAAVFHFIWHLRYYGEMLKDLGKKSKNRDKEQSAGIKSDTGVSRRVVLTALFILGFTSILSQIIIIREFLNVFQGNELIIGMIFCIWMLITAAGSKLGQHLVSLID